jgi:RNA polymerase sigma factor (sigma-70 family)
MGSAVAIVAVPRCAVRFDAATDYHADPAGHGIAVTNRRAGEEAESTGETTLALLTRAQQGDAPSIEALFERVVPTLRRWARGRLPGYARDLADTQDLVQETVLHTLKRLHAFEPRHQGALQAYLRQAIANRIRDEIRRVRRRPLQVELNDGHVDGAPSPLEQAIGREGFDKYEAALLRLKASDREAIVARLELQQSYEEIAIALGRPTANAARVAVMRAIAHLIEAMNDQS